MEAACEGVAAGREAFGSESLSIGILPGEEAASANPYVDIAIPTGMGIGRNVLVARAADALIAIDGASGTLSELAYGWQLGKPIIALLPSGGWAARLAGTAIDGRREDTVIGARTAEEAVRLAALRVR